MSNVYEALKIHKEKLKSLIKKPEKTDTSGYSMILDQVEKTEGNEARKKLEEILKSNPPL